MFQLGDRVAHRASRLGEDYLVLGRVIGTAAETARLQVIWDMGGCDEMAAAEVVAVPEGEMARGGRVTVSAANGRAVERAWGDPSTTQQIWDQIDALDAEDLNPEPQPVPDWQRFYPVNRWV